MSVTSLGVIFGATEPRSLIAPCPGQGAALAGFVMLDGPGGLLVHMARTTAEVANDESIVRHVSDVVHSIGSKVDEVFTGGNDMIAELEMLDLAGRGREPRELHQRGPLLPHSVRCGPTGEVLR